MHWCLRNTEIKVSLRLNYFSCGFRGSRRATPRVWPQRGGKICLKSSSLIWLKRISLEFVFVVSFVIFKTWITWRWFVSVLFQSVCRIWMQRRLLITALTHSEGCVSARAIADVPSKPCDSTRAKVGHQFSPRCSWLRMSREGVCDVCDQSRRRSPR